MVEFAGFSLPLRYTSELREHLAVRQRAGAFDVSHMGRLMLSGPGALDTVQRVCSNDAAALSPGRAQYSLMLNERAGIVDDLIVCRLAEERFLLVVNAINRDKDRQWLAERAAPQTTVDDLSEELAMIAVQGPAAEGILVRLGAEQARALSRFALGEMDVAGVRCLVSRTGYTGEDGFELCCPAGEAERVWEAVLAGEPGAEPCGLAARDSLRIEACLPLWGNELSEEITPVEARLSWVVKPEKGEFCGREAFLRAREAGAARKLVALKVEGRRVPRRGATVRNMRGEAIGEVSSGSFSPVLNCGVGLAFVAREAAEVGERLRVDVGRGEVLATVAKKPLVGPS